MNALKPGVPILVRHYSGLKPIKSVVLDVGIENMSIKLTKEFEISNFLEGDPVVFGYQADEEVYILGSDILNVNAKTGQMLVKVDTVDPEAERREFERFPVSLYADIRKKKSDKKHLATIKDISYYGMMMYSKLNLEVNQRLDIDIYMDKTMLFLMGDVVRKVETSHHFQYGLKLVYPDLRTMNYMKDYIKRLALDQEYYIRKSRLLP